MWPNFLTNSDLLWNQLSFKLTFDYFTIIHHCFLYRDSPKSQNTQFFSDTTRKNTKHENLQCLINQVNIGVEAVSWKKSAGTERENPFRVINDDCCQPAKWKWSTGLYKFHFWSYNTLSDDERNSSKTPEGILRGTYVAIPTVC